MSLRTALFASAVLLTSSVIPDHSFANQARGSDAEPARVAARVPATSAANVSNAVRRAVGYNRLSKFRHGLVITESEQGKDESASTIYLGRRHGKLRSGESFGFDGAFHWQRDEKRGIAVPNPQRNREKNSWPLWIRGYWWLNPASGISVAVLPEETTAETVALSLTLQGGIVPATLHVDRSTWLPSKLVVAYERGPFTARYSDYRPVNGVSVAFVVETSYRSDSRRLVQSVHPIADESIFAAPRIPSDHKFDGRRPAALMTAAGAPFSLGSPGHNYVRAAADDGAAGWWHFDSGSDSMIIDTAVANQLGMPIIGTHRSMGADGTPREGTWRRGKSFTLGRIRIENPVYRALDLSKNNAPPGERRMGTIGYDLFARSVVEYDDNGLAVRVCDPGTYRLPKGAQWQRLEHIDSTPAVRGLVENRFKGLFQIDTGSAGSIDFTKQFHETHRLLEGRETTSAAQLGSGGTFSVEQGTIRTFKLAGREYKNVAVLFRTGGISREGSAGTVGRELLRSFAVVFDYIGHRVAFAPPGARGNCG